MFIRNLSISTNVRLHPEFVTDPRSFARRRKVHLADEVFPQTDIRKAPKDPDDPNDPNDPGSDERIERIKVNIHLVQHGAIRLLAERDVEDYWVRSIDLGPSMLLYEAKRYVLAAGDLRLSLSILRDNVSPLLSDPLDARHIVPGLVRDDEEPVASWSEVDTEFLFPGIDIRCFHGLSHPDTGPADGAIEKRIQFGDKQDECVIRIKEAKWEIDGPDGAQAVEGVRVRLILKGRMLTNEFMPFGATAKVNNTMRLVGFSMADIARVHQAVMARMEGTFLPIPPEWAHMGKPLTRAKAVALVSQLTSISLEELQAMYEDIRHPSKSTRKRLRKGAAAAACLKPIPVSELFHESAYVAGVSEATPHADGRIDPLVAAVYG